MSIRIIDIIKIDFNITEIGISNLHLKAACDKCRTIDLLDNYGVLRFNDLTASLGLNYEYITDPPIFGDIGTFAFDLHNTSLLLNSSTTYNETANALQIDLSKLELE